MRQESACGFEGDLLEPPGDQVLAQLQHRIDGRGHLLHQGVLPARPVRVRHPGAHHPGGFRHIDCSHPLQNPLVLLVGSSCGSLIITPFHAPDSSRKAARGLGRKPDF
jgi:hypothetical protein